MFRLAPFDDMQHHVNVSSIRGSPGMIHLMAVAGRSVDHIAAIMASYTILHIAIPMGWSCAQLKA